MKNKSLSILLSGALALALSACGGGSVDGNDDNTGGQTGNGGLTEVRYGIFPSNTVGAFEVAKDEGIFEKHGIDLELVVGAGSSAAQLPALTTGDLDFMLASPVTPITAAERGLDIKIVSGVTQNDPEIVEESTVVVTGPSSDIKTAKDLAGKTVSVNALGGVGEIGIRAAVENDGGDPDSVTFVQLSFPEVAAQLESGQIDAGMAGSPFIQQVTSQGGSVVSDFIPEAGLSKNELVSIASGKLVNENPELVERFNDAMTEATAYLNEHEDEIRKALPEAVGADPKVAEKAQFSIYSTEIDPKTIQTFADLMQKYEVTKEDYDASSLIYQP